MGVHAGGLLGEANEVAEQDGYLRLDAAGPQLAVPRLLDQRGANLGGEIGQQTLHEALASFEIGAALLLTQGHGGVLSDGQQKLQVSFLE